MLTNRASAGKPLQARNLSPSPLLAPFIPCRFSSISSPRRSFFVDKQGYHTIRLLYQSLSSINTGILINSCDLSTMSEGLDGCFPRLNASLLRQGSFNDCLASFVGKMESHNTFRCCDGGTITLTDVAFDMDEVEKDMVVEIMGQTIDQSTVQVRPFVDFEKCSWQAAANESFLTPLFSFPSLLYPDPSPLLLDLYPRTRILPCTTKWLKFSTTPSLRSFLLSNISSSSQGSSHRWLLFCDTMDCKHRAAGNSCVGTGKFVCKASPCHCATFRVRVGRLRFVHGWLDCWIFPTFHKMPNSLDNLHHTE